MKKTEASGRCFGYVYRLQLFAATIAIAVALTTTGFLFFFAHLIHLLSYIDDCLWIEINFFNSSRRWLGSLFDQVPVRVRADHNIGQPPFGSLSNRPVCLLVLE